MKMKYIDAATKFIEDHFPDCSFALVAGSVVRGDATSTSDLDIFIITTKVDKPYRESFYENGWPIEAFIHTLDSYQEFFYMDIKRRRPSSPMMCSEGILLKDTLNIEGKIRKFANDLLAMGPEPFSEQEMLNQRYHITDMLDDLIGSTDYEEQLFIANELIEKLINFILVNRGQWMGRGKWIPKLLKKLDEDLYHELMYTINELFKKENKLPLIGFVTQQLNNTGGRLFEGYTLGK